MARKSKHDEISDGDLRRLLNRYNCPMPFHAVDDANELMNALINGLWNRLTRHQSRKHPFRLMPLR